MWRAPVFGLLTLGVAWSAQAEFRLLIDEADIHAVPRKPAIIQGQQARYADMPRLLQRGVPVETRVVFKPAQQLSINEALAQLLPMGWTAQVHPAWQNYAVSWPAGERWSDVLAGIGQKLGADMLIDWSQRRVVLDPAIRNAWVLRGKSLRENIERWARQAGWHFRWQIQGYRDLTISVDSVLPLELTLQQALEHIVKSYRYEQIINLKADFFESNLTIVLRCDQGGC